MDQYIIDVPMFNIRIDSIIRQVNEYTLRNLLLANANGEIDFEVEVCSPVEGSIPHYFRVDKGSYIDFPISTTNEFSFSLLTDLKFKLLRTKVK